MTKILIDDIKKKPNELKNEKIYEMKFYWAGFITIRFNNNKKSINLFENMIIETTPKLSNRVKRQKQNKTKSPRISKKMSDLTMIKVQDKGFVGRK